MYRKGATRVIKTTHVPFIHFHSYFYTRVCQTRYLSPDQTNLCTSMCPAKCQSSTITCASTWLDDPTSMCPVRLVATVFL